MSAGMGLYCMSCDGSVHKVVLLAAAVLAIPSALAVGAAAGAAVLLLLAFASTRAPAVAGA